MNHIPIFATLLGPAAAEKMLEFIIGDAEQPLKYQADAHSASLVQISAWLVGADAMSMPDRRRSFLTTVARTLSFVERRVPISDSQNPFHDLKVPSSYKSFQEQKLSELVGISWKDDVISHLNNLVHAYLCNGYMDLSSTAIPNPAGHNPASYLEVAMMASNHAAVKTLLEKGASEHLVPAKKFAEASDIDGFLDAVFGAGSTPMRRAVEEGRRLQMAKDMSATIARAKPAVQDTLGARPSIRRQL